MVSFVFHGLILLLKFGACTDAQRSGFDLLPFPNEKHPNLCYMACSWRCDCGIKTKHADHFCGSLILVKVVLSMSITVRYGYIKMAAEGFIQLSI